MPICIEISIHIGILKCVIIDRSTDISLIQSKEHYVVGKVKKRDFDIKKAVNMSSAEIAQYLDDRERRFAREYLVDRNGTQAAVRAGYKPGKNNASAAVQGSRLTKDPRIIAYRRSLLKDELEAQDINREHILSDLIEIKTRCMQAAPVIAANENEQTEIGIYEFDARGAIKALSEMSKLVGLYAPERREISPDDNLESLMQKIFELRND